MKLWDLARNVYHEAIYQGQVQSAGSNVHRLHDKMKSDGKYIRRQAGMVQGIGSFYMLAVATLSVIAFVEMRETLPTSWNVLVASLSITVQLFIQSGYLMMLTLLATAEILAPDLYRWPASLPLSNDQIGALKVLALAREYLMPLSVIIVTIPLVAGLASGSPAAGLTGILVGISHAAMTLGIAVLASWRLRKALRESDGSDRRSSVARVVSILIYGVGTLVVLFVMQIGSSVIANLFDSPRMMGRSLAILMQALALAPLPTAPAALLATVAAGATVRLLPVWMPIVGTAGYVLLALLVIRRASAIVRGLDEGTRQIADSAHGAVDAIVGRGANAPLDVRPPRAAFRRQIARTATRDTQALISLLFPLIFPLLVTLGPTISAGDATVGAVLVIVMGTVMSSWMVIQGTTRQQSGTGGLEATLPVRERDRVFPRLWLAALLPLGGVLITVLALFPGGSPVQRALLLQTLAVPVAGPAGFLVKVALFGKVRSGSNPFVLDEVNTGARFWKWVAVIATLAVLSAAIRFGFGLVSPAVFIAAVVAVAAIEVLMARRMFP